MSFPRIASLKTVADFRNRLQSLGCEIGCDDQIQKAPDSPLAAPLTVDGFTMGNRWVIHPMEGWDAEPNGQPSEYVRRRWRNFGRSGAKWIWGGEAMAVTPDVRANPRQTIIDDSTRDGLAQLVDECRAAHRAEHGSDDDLFIGFQITHSGRYSKPYRQDKMEPQIAYRHPVLDRRLKLGPDYPLLTDDDLRRLIDTFVHRAGIAESCGAHFVDIKHCHGYLLHELLGAHTRPGDFGGSLENRTRVLREVTAGIRATTKLKVGVRLSAFDFVAYRPDPALTEGKKLGPGIPEDLTNALPYRYGFSADPDNPTRVKLDEAKEFLQVVQDLGITMVNLSAGSPYYNPHIQRPALFPPSDGYQPPEDPLVGCVRQIRAAAQLKQAFPKLTLIGTAYTYLQEYLPHVAQWVVRNNWIDAVGLGRMVLSYPTLPADTLREGKLVRGMICRTFSDCTTGPRNGIISGCYPLDPFYKALPEAEQLKVIKGA
jgi:NADPH2 dehydrogenase